LRHNPDVAARTKVAESYVLRELAELRALADPLRQRLLRAFAAKPQTTKQVAHSLKESPTKLYHHVDTLAQAGLLRLVRTQQKRGTLERYYQAAAKQFAVHHNIFRHLSAKRIGPERLFANAFNNALSEIRKNLDHTSKGRTALLQARLCGTPAEAIALREKVQAILQKPKLGRRARTRKTAEETFEILFAIYPIRSRKPLK
jgi:DNA-binding transcriptional ArsR family regulator